MKSKLTVIFSLLAYTLVANNPDSLLKQAETLLGSDLKQAEVLANTALDQFKKEGNNKDIAATYFILGYINDEQNYLANAAIYYLEAVRLEEADDYTRLSCLKNLGRIFKVYDRIKEAEKYYTEALELARDYSKNEAAGILYNLGNLHKANKDFEKAQAAYLQAYTISLEQNDFTRLANLTNQIGLVFKELKDYSTAREYYFRMLNAEEQLKDSYNKFAGRAWHNIAVTHLEEGNYSEAINGYLTALKFKQLTGKDQFITFLDLGDAYNRAGNKEQALEAWVTALGMIPQGEPDPEHFVIYKHLASQHADNFELYKNYTDLYAAQWETYYTNTRQITDMDQSYRFHITIEQYFNKQVENQRTRQYALLTVALVVLFASILVGIWYYRSRSEKKFKDELGASVRDILNS